MEKLTMKELKHTLDLENYIVNNLKSDEDIKLYLKASLKDYLDDGDFNSFYRALEIVIKAKDTVSNSRFKSRAARTLPCPAIIVSDSSIKTGLLNPKASILFAI